LSLRHSEHRHDFTFVPLVVPNQDRWHARHAAARVVSGSPAPSGPDLRSGIPLSSLADGAMVQGHVGDEPVLLVRRGDEVFALAAHCTHYGAPLADGLLDGETIRCPWHHACFALRTGGVLRAPARDALKRWRVDQADGLIRVGEPIGKEDVQPLSESAGLPRSIVIVGGGPAGVVAAETLRREGFTGAITMLSADADLPCDRPNLSKNYLAGSAPQDWLPLRSRGFYRKHNIDLHVDTRVTSVDAERREVTVADGTRYSYDALLLATGATPVRLDITGAELPHVHSLRTHAEGESIVAAATTAKRAAIVGASFIGLEVAASLRARDIAVEVVGRETVPMEKVLGAEVGQFIRALHEHHGVVFHLGCSPASIDDGGVALDTGEHLAADLVVVGIGVRPETALAEAMGLALDRGVAVNEYLETSMPGVFAAGDIARWPDPLSGDRIRVEHFVVAERQGEVAARNILGRRERFDHVPFFWTEQYDFSLGYVGHAEGWDSIAIDGDLQARDCTITYRRKGRKLAVAVIHRDHAGLVAELEFESEIARREARGVTASSPALGTEE
jgi:NADPH-dependent 2,4-dienoyl-CoA reductase/sulfur reductase-like enzyme/nitrite reductase/ring-hydroxylating ferredoxin subunit